MEIAAKGYKELKELSFRGFLRSFKLKEALFLACLNPVESDHHKRKHLPMNSWTRREFTKTLVLAGATTALGAARAANANERVRLGFIGLGNRGDQVLDAFLKQADAEVTAVCDLSQAYMDFAAQKTGTSP